MSTLKTIARLSLLAVIGISIKTDANALVGATCPFVSSSEDEAVLTAAKDVDTPLHMIWDWNNWLAPAYLTDSSWDPWANPPHVDFLHPANKMSNAYMLLAEGHYDTYVGWHPNSQYLAESMSKGSMYHDNTPWNYADTLSGTEALTSWPILNTSFWCQLFGGTGTVSGTTAGSNGPSERAAVIIHEMWHAWQYDHKWDPSHGNNCPAGTSSCDFFYPHTQIQFLPGDTYTAGDLQNESVVPWRFHSPYQMAMEYQCDLSEFSRPWVPISTAGAAGAARAFSNFRKNNNFVNAVGWTCGSPLPFD